MDVFSLASLLPVGGALLPWLALGAFLAFAVREPRALPATPSRRWDGAGSAGEGASLVSVVVPARNEEDSIARCLESLVRQRDVAFEVVVVDDRSTDRTGEVSRSVARGNARRLEVLDGSPLPDGWFGKPWACRQGAQAAAGDRLLFTDADTEHEPELLRRALVALDEDRADAVSVVGRQELGTFWERLVQPQIFALMALRFRRLDRVLEADRWEEAIANGQYILVRRAAYEAVGGHEAVRAEVAEDLRLAQELTRGGHRLSVRAGADALSTRMYTSLGELVNGWTKNVAVGGRQAAGWWGALALPAMVAFIAVMWLLPPAVLAGVLVAEALGAVAAGGAVVAWAAGASGISTLLWAAGYRRFEVSGRYALLYPLGAAVTLFIVLRSWIRGSRRIEWKGRRYRGADGVAFPSPGDAGRTSAVVEDSP